MANGTTNGQTIVKIAQFLIPIVLGMGGAWGVIQYKEGDRERRILVLETQLTKLENNMISRQEMGQFMNASTETLRQIREDIRELRSR